MSKQQATIVETPDASNGFRWKVQRDGEKWPDYLSGPGAPPAYTPTETVGTIEYRSGAGYGLFFWCAAALLTLFVAAGCTAVVENNESSGEVNGTNAPVLIGPPAETVVTSPPAPCVVAESENACGCCYENGPICPPGVVPPSQNEPFTLPNCVDE